MPAQPHRRSNKHDMFYHPGFAGAAARFWQRSYASDYVGLAILITGYTMMQFFAEPFHRMFFLDNLAIGYPHAEMERVPVSWLFIYAGAVPLGILIAWSLVARPGTHKAHVTILGWFISMILTTFLTDVIKNAVGRPRPDLIARCKPRPGTPAHALVTYEVCTEPDHHILHDGWRSFPSGHSSFSFSGLGYLALVIAGQCHVYRPRADLARVLVALAPLLGAALIAISRCEESARRVRCVGGLGAGHGGRPLHLSAVLSCSAQQRVCHTVSQSCGWWGGKAQGRGGETARRAGI